MWCIDRSALDRFVVFFFILWSLVLIVELCGKKLIEYTRRERNGRTAMHRSMYRIYWRREERQKGHLYLFMTTMIMALKRLQGVHIHTTSTPFVAVCFSRSFLTLSLSHERASARGFAVALRSSTDRSGCTSSSTRTRCLPAVHTRIDFGRATH